MAVIKEQLPEYSWDSLGIIVGLIKRKYGLGAEILVEILLDFK